MFKDIEVIHGETLLPPSWLVELIEKEGDNG